MRPNVAVTEIKHPKAEILLVPQDMQTKFKINKVQTTFLIQYGSHFFFSSFFRITI